jgi:hypothetical protein
MPICPCLKSVRPVIRHLSPNRRQAGSAPITVTVYRKEFPENTNLKLSKGTAIIVIRYLILIESNKSIVPFLALLGQISLVTMERMLRSLFLANNAELSFKVMEEEFFVLGHAIAHINVVILLLMEADLYLFANNVISSSKLICLRKEDFALSHVPMDGYPLI